MANAPAQTYSGWIGGEQNVPFNQTQFSSRHREARIRTTELVKVIKVYPGDPMATPPVPTTVDVQPVVNMVDSQGNKQAHDVIYGRPCMRNHGGGNAILNDPVEGDVGVMVVPARDTSSVEANSGAISSPGSDRRHDLSDGLFLGGVWTPNPTNFIDLRGGNISHVSTKVGSGTGKISHTAGDTITHTAKNDITHTTTDGDIIHTATKGNITHSAPEGALAFSSMHGTSITSGGLTINGGGTNLTGGLNVTGGGDLS